ncbi:hypothetical protein [Dongia sp.]|uniref:hypothetical protein n=1 Tax=Dongia sp. TaxID=1977262 RepID=UPI0035B439A5
MMTRWETTRRTALCAASAVIFAAQISMAGSAAADSIDAGNLALGYPLGISLEEFTAMPLPFDGLPKGATVKCGDDPDLRQRMVGYVADNEARYEKVGVKSCRVVAPDPANLSWWRPVEIDVDGVKARIRFDFMEVSDASNDGFDDTGFSDALYGGNDLGAAGGGYALVSARLSPVKTKDGYKLLANLNQRLGNPKVVKDKVEVAPGISFTMPVHTWRTGPVSVAAWDPSELGHYDLVFTLTDAKADLQARLDDIN